jgi:hypothetical protein
MLDKLTIEDTAKVVVIPKVVKNFDKVIFLQRQMCVCIKNN